MNKTTKTLLILLISVLMALTSLALLSCDLFNNDKPERLDIMFDGDITFSVTKDELPEHLTVIYFDKTGSSRSLAESEYEITSMEKVGFNGDTLMITVSYQGLTKTASIGLMADPVFQVWFNSYFKFNQGYESFGRDYKKGVELKESDLPTPTRSGWTFLYWCYDEELQHRFDGSDPEPGILFGKWKYNLEAGATEGLEYSVNDTWAEVIGLGTATDKDIVVASKYDNKPVTRIVPNAFKNTDITSIVLPSTVQYIEEQSFYNCPELLSVKTSGNLELISNQAFYNCSKLFEFIFADGVRDITDQAFYGCASLREVKLPASIRSIGEQTFANCSSLKTFELRSDAEIVSDVYVGFSVLLGCDNLETLVCPSAMLKWNVSDVSVSTWSLPNVTEAEIYCGELYGLMLEGLPKLSTLIIGERVTSVGYFGDLPIKKLVFNAVNCKGDVGEDGVFSHFTDFPEFEIGNKVTRIPDYMFYNCPNLTSVELPASVNWVGRYAFAKSGLEELTVLGDTWYTPVSGVFTDCSKLETVIGPMSVLKNLPYTVKSLTLTNGETLTALPVYLTELYLPDTLTSFGNVTLPNYISNYTTDTDGSKYLGSKTNRRLALIEAVTDGDTYEVASETQAIYYSAFDKLSLSSVTVESDNTHFVVWLNVLYDSAKTVLVHVPKLYVGDVKIADGVTAIAANQFANRSYVRSITLPQSVISIGKAAFSGCSKLQSINIPQKVTVISQETFMNCVALTTVELPSDVTEIGTSAFKGCTLLDNVTLPQKLTDIGYYAFENCTSLTSVELPATLKYLGTSAYQGCVNLETIKYAGTKEQYSSNVNQNVTVFDVFKYVKADKMEYADGDFDSIMNNY